MDRTTEINTDVFDEIVVELYRMVENYGGMSDILSYIGS
jgi:hypothetical protein